MMGVVMTGRMMGVSDGRIRPMMMARVLDVGGVIVGPLKIGVDRQCPIEHGTAVEEPPVFQDFEIDLVPVNGLRPTSPRAGLQ
jgi:hypothetical protein